ncbi:protein kinase [Roseiconus nitratireducens]|uniref:non-specific serine/threonine protein kinase n=1 Tax=Roseiconus nitratireducens TaxID=2605748 RepID=A0A5M6CW44_9BACT|nr:protein kinase [Roseiconus nitratireducens]KAA5539176.1 protein kinase [Roseiconus nitratireducens]
MESPNKRCRRCGTPLPFQADDSCQKCLLEVGLASGTDFSIGSLAETLPGNEEHPSAGDSGSESAVRATRRPVGMRAYRDLQAVHDWSGGTIYRAFHSGLERVVLLRVLDASADAETRQNFLRRAQTLSQLNHPHTATILEAGMDQGAAYVAEEWVDGQPVSGFGPRNLKERSREGFFPNERLIRTLRDAASGLQAMHQIGLAHHRIAPDAIVVDRSGVVKLVGLERAAEASDDRFAAPPAEGGRVDQGDEVDSDNAIHQDLFRLGATFCFMTTGRLPAELDAKLDHARLSRQIKLTNPGLRKDLCGVIAGCVARESSHHGSQASDGDPNPYRQDRDGQSPVYRSVDAVVHDLEDLSHFSVQRCSSRLRFFSGYLEAFLLVLVIALIQAIVRRQQAGGAADTSEVLVSLIFVLPFCYWMLFETVVGWTPIRRVFGMRLLSHSGEPAAWWRRFGRAFQKLVLVALTIVVPAMLPPLIAMTGHGGVYMLLITPILTLILPPMVLYLPTYWTPSRWTSYDLTAGVTWGETVKLPADVPREAFAATGAQRQASPVARIDQYDLFEPLGTGGMGQVFRGHDRILHRDVAIKLLSESLGSHPLLLERFEREARLAAKVSHPGVAKVFGNGVTDHSPYIAMEYVRGKNLQQVIKQQGSLPVKTAWDYVRQAAEGLRAAHHSGVVHRDVKPANLMVTDDGKLKVTDFGVSRPVDLDSEVTQAGTIVGTPAYMAPEQAMGKQVDSRSDIYALGMTFYHMLSGQAPFKASNAVEMLALQMSESPSSLFGQVEDLTIDQASVLEKMIEKDPGNRYASYDALIRDLVRYAPDADQPTSPLKRIAAETCNWAAGYLAFTCVIFSVFLLGQRFGASSRNGTLVVGGTILLLYLAFVGSYVVGIARSGTTPGKRLLGLRVRVGKRRNVGYGRSLIRFAVAYPVMSLYAPRILYYVIAQVPGTTWDRFLLAGVLVLQGLVTVASLGLMWMRPDGRAVHDWVAGTRVVADTP